MWEPALLAIGSFFPFSFRIFFSASGDAFPLRGFALKGESLFFQQPKKSNQKKAAPRPAFFPIHTAMSGNKGASVRASGSE